MVSFCELCGKQTDEKRKVKIENSIFNVCMSCSKRGKPIESSNNYGTTQGKNKIIGKTTSQYPTTTPLSRTAVPRNPAYNRIRPMPRIKPPPQKKINLTDEMILDPEFPMIIRNARNKKGITHDQLGQKINEKVTLLKKIETGNIKPDGILSKKLENFLGIKLFISSNEDITQEENE
ncbi:MAG TPA: multiprotein-bridging factor 1 family protein [Verrucomicrobiae bacterium]|nr:multiprotein-bridging factor 1 family protein [Verrucomicrobiae bacterium]